MVFVKLSATILVQYSISFRRLLSGCLDLQYRIRGRKCSKLKPLGVQEPDKLSCYFSRGTFHRHPPYLEAKQMD